MFDRRQTGSTLQGHDQAKSQLDLHIADTSSRGHADAEPELEVSLLFHLVLACLLCLM